MCPALATIDIDDHILGFHVSGIGILDSGFGNVKDENGTQSAIKRLTTQPQRHYLVGQVKKILEELLYGLAESTFYDSSFQPSWATIN